MRYVTSGECGYGIVYRSDARKSPVQVLHTFAARDHAAIRYPVALIRSNGMIAPDAATARDADAFYKFLFSPAAGRIFHTFGFEWRAGETPATTGPHTAP